MKKFNPDKELSKIRNGNKNKIIVGLCTLLFIVVVGYSFALYQVRHTNKLVFNTVGEFKKRDIYLSVLVDGKTQSDFPDKNDGYVFDNIICDKPGIEASFNNDTWKLTLTTGTTNKCTVKFITKPYMDESGANYPDLFQGLIPIRYDNNKIYIADYKEKWYDYNNHEWANAVLIDHNNPEVMEKFYTDGKLNVNTEITTDDILQMYVWIPRYKYQLFNAVSGQSSNPQMINIKFENTIETTGEVRCTYANMKNGTIQENCINAENGNWYTHPAFTFGDTELRGIWVGKFEPSDPTDVDGTKNDTIGEITILPNKVSMTVKTISTMFNVTRKIEDANNKYNLNPDEVDTHLMKNMEWGAVTYFSQSKYGIFTISGEEITCNIDNTKTESTCAIWNNNTAHGLDNSSGTITGCVGDVQDSLSIINVQSCPGNEWNNSSEVKKASTTANIYGIYDMAGGMWEYVMGNMVKADGTFYSSRSGFTDTNPRIDSKYYDSYGNDSVSTTYYRGHLGDATREILQTFGSNTGSWNEDYSFFLASSNSWFSRNGHVVDSAKAGVFAFSSYDGGVHKGHSFRSVLSAA